MYKNFEHSSTDAEGGDILSMVSARNWPKGSSLIEPHGSRFPHLPRVPVPCTPPLGRSWKMADG